MCGHCDESKTLKPDPAPMILIVATLRQSHRYARALALADPGNRHLEAWCLQLSRALAACLPETDLTNN